MRRRLSTRLTKAVFLIASLALLLGLSSMPTHASAARTGDDVGTAAVTLTLYGPNSILTTGYYNYRAVFNAPYSNYYWYYRYCSTDTLASCSVAWTRLYQGYVTTDTDSTYTKYLILDCSNNRTRSFQVRVDANAFAQPTQTAYKVTKLCGTEPL